MHLSPRADRAADAALVAGSGLGDPPAAAVLVRAWPAATTYDPGRASVATWLLTVTRNTAIDAVRARRATPTPAQALEAVVEGTFTTTDPAETAMHRLEAARALRHLATLHPAPARAVVLAIVGGCAAVEVSGREGTSLGTAETRIRTGLSRLHASMQEEAGE